MKTQATILLTRPDPECSINAKEYEALGLHVVKCPLFYTDYTPVGSCTLDNRPDCGLILSSTRAVSFLAQYIQYRKIHRKTPGTDHRTILCVGHKTYESVQALLQSCKSTGKTQATTIHWERTGQELYEWIIKHQNSPTYNLPHCFDYLHADQIAFPMAEFLGNHNITVRSHCVYNMVPIPSIPDHVMTLLYQKKVQCILFYSARTADMFFKILPANLLKNTVQTVRFLCMSSRIKKRVETHIGVQTAPQIHVSDNPTHADMVKLTSDIIANASPQ